MVQPSLERSLIDIFNHEDHKIYKVSEDQKYYIKSENQSPCSDNLSKSLFLRPS
jgi:hypothetical protein